MGRIDATNPQRLVYHNPELLAAATAARLVTELADLQAANGSASLVLTGGGVGISVLSQLRDAPARDAIDWHNLDLYWGDERFVPADSPERNEKQARDALLNHVPVDPGKVHAMPPSDGRFGDDPDAAARWYAGLLDEQASRETHRARPIFDVLLLGMGDDGHVASIFPDSPAAEEQETMVTAVRRAPKPPQTRLTLTFPAIRHAAEVWVLTAGAAKADAVALAHAGANRVRLPMAGAQGHNRTRWLLDRQAARALSDPDRDRDPDRQHTI